MNLCLIADEMERRRNFYAKNFQPGRLFTIKIEYMVNDGMM